MNSGTVIGPIDDVRALITATMAEIEEIYDENYEWKNSDQFYITNIWGRQEQVFRGEETFSNSTNETNLS